MMIKSKQTYSTCSWLLVIPLTAALSGCFESNSETPPPGLDGSGGDGSASIGVDDSLRVAVGSAGGSLDVLRNDPSGVEIIDFDSVSENNGTVSRDGSSGYFNYVPEASYAGADKFTYTIKTANGNTSTVTVNVTVNDDIIISGRDYFNKECGICHKAGAEDQLSAFNASDLVQSSNNFDYDMSMSDTLWDPPLMRYYSSLSQKQVDGLRAYIGSLRNP